MQKIQMALMLAAQQFQQNRTQRFCGKLFVQKARNQLYKQPPRQAAQAGCAEYSVSRYAGRTDRQLLSIEQDAAAHQEQRNRASCKAAPEQTFQPRSAPDLPAKQDLTGYMNHHNAENRKCFRVINGGDSPSGHSVWRFLKRLHNVPPIRIYFCNASCKHILPKSR